MDKPKLEDYGLKGIDSRPQIDIEAMPISFAERDAAIDRIIKWEVGNERCRRFRAALNDYDWANKGYGE